VRRRLTFVGAIRLRARQGGHRTCVGPIRRPALILTPHDERCDAATGRLASFVEAIGARAHVMTPEAHDHLVAYLSHLPQLVVSGLMQVVARRSASLARDAGRGLIDTTRLASSPRRCGPTSARPTPTRLALRSTGRSRCCSAWALTDGRTVADVFDQAADWRGRLPGATT
jgi:prephenate dehydrogenase